MAAFGPTVGREATVDALSWAWEHWGKVAPMENPVGYLYRVGQTAALGALSKRSIGVRDALVAVDVPDMTPELVPALAALSEQQRIVVVMVHGHGYSLRETAEVLGISVSTVREHTDRAIEKLRRALEVPS